MNTAIIARKNEKSLENIAKSVIIEDTSKAALKREVLRLTPSEREELLMLLKARKQ